MNGGHGQLNEATFCLLTNSASACNIMMVGFEFGETVVLNCFLRLLVLHILSPIEKGWFMLAQRLARYTTPAATPDQLRQYVEAALTVVPQGYVQNLFDSMPRRVTVVIANNSG
ncbi:hypothetical protein TNCV_2161421 [Trichonephila clavipes]|nr:hypothetical protein TNCV_2161421 [Trichonephila clavipes]